MWHGAVHIGGLYPNRSGDFVSYGASEIKAVGFKTIKIEFSSVYATKYVGQTFAGTYTTLAQLAADPCWTALFNDSWWDRFIITAFPFGDNSINNPWAYQWTDTLGAIEQQEMYDLVVYLLSTFSNKHFIIQNWEGDYQLLNSFDPSHNVIVPRHTLNSYCDWQRRRMRAVQTARAATSSTSRVTYHMEMSRALDTSGERLYHSVLDKFLSGNAIPDSVGFSSYEAMNGWVLGLTQTQFAADLMTKFGLLVQNTRRTVGPSMPMYVTEYGYPLYNPTFIAGGYNVAQLYSDTIAACVAAGIEGMVFWQVFDNTENSPGNPAGFALYNRNGSSSSAGSLTAAGVYYQSIL